VVQGLSLVALFPAREQQTLVAAVAAQNATTISQAALAAQALSSLELHPQHLPRQDRLLSQLTAASMFTNSRDQGALRSNGTLCRT
jgi:hypothetical protein